MDFPVFHLDFIGNRLLVAITAITHVVINHPMAVGAVPLVTFLEWRAHRRGDPALDQLAYRLTFVFFIITTSVGALTGVGIWFTAALVNPEAIGSLLRVFFWAWFLEWFVFVIEVALILFYFLTWKTWRNERKMAHIRTGLFLSIFSWFTMAIITGILGFMMNSGDWVPFIREWSPRSGMLTAFFNPLYAPQLVFRTPLALLGAGLFFLFLVPFFTAKGSGLRAWSARTLGIWILLWLPPTAAGALWYWRRIPEFMTAHAPVALATQNYTSWYGTILQVLLAAVLVIALIASLAALLPQRLPRAATVFAFVLSVALLGTFERVREFIRKPFVIEDYLYANGFRLDHYPLYAEKGVLPYATFVSSRNVEAAGQVEAGRDIFLLTCSRCHTVNGINSVNAKFSDLFPGGPWQQEQISAYIGNMHNIRPFMPPFPGTPAERDALAAFILSEQEGQRRYEGAQSAGVKSVSER